MEAGIDLAPFIETAAALVDRVEQAGLQNSDRLELIERWLAAHFYTVRDPRTTSESAGPVSATYQSVVGPGLRTSQYGQVAITLDETGTLRKISEPVEISVHFLGQHD